MQLTIERIYPAVREFDGKNGRLAVVKVLFDDGTEGEYLTTPDGAPKIKEALNAFVGKPTEYELGEEKEYQGVTQRKIRSWPGKQQGPGGGGGGGRNYVPAFHQTKEGFLIEQTMMNARTSIMTARETGTINDWTPDQMFSWMQSKLQDAVRIVFDAPKQAERINTPVAPQNASPNEHQAGNGVPAPTNGKVPRGTINDTGSACSVCHAPPGKPHLGPCILVEVEA